MEWSGSILIGPTKQRKEHKGANLFVNTRISTTRGYNYYLDI